MLWVVGAIVVLSLLSTTPASRAEARAKLARWNPLFIAILLIELGLIFYPWPPMQN
jgi:cadmium resistance protein CadD (predicted permease)